MILLSESRMTYERFVYEKNGFAYISKNLVRYRSENNFVRP